MRYPVFVMVLSASLLAATVALSQGGDYLSDAERLQAKGDFRAAEIQLKNAVRSDPKNMAAHYRLALVQLQLGEAAAAEHEASVARTGGYDPDHTVPLLTQAYLAQQKYRQVLEEFPGTEGSNAERAGVLLARGYAQIALGNREEGRQSFQAAQSLLPQAPGPLLAEAKLLMSERQFASAEPLFDRALATDPKSTEARLGKARLLAIGGKPEEALSALDQLISDSPGYADARLARAEILLAQDKQNAAKADVDAVLKLQPANVGAVYLDAVLAAKTKDFQKANTDLEKISKILPSIQRGYYLQALVDYNLKYFEQAEDAARRFTARNPDDLPGQKLLGLIELALGRPADTIDALAKFESEGKADVGTLNLLGRAYTQVGKTSEALAAFSAAVKLAPTDASLRTSLGGVQLRAGHVGEAIADLEQSLDLAPSAPAAEMLVLSQLTAGDWPQASAAVKKLQEAQSNSPVPGNLSGLISLARFDLESAHAQFAELAKDYPQFLPARLNLSRTLDLEGKPDQAEEVLKGILNEQPVNTMVLTRFVDLCLRSGKSAIAVQAAEKAHSADPANQGLTVGLIDLYLRVGQKDKALALAREENGSNDRKNIALIAARARAELAAGMQNDAAETYRRVVALVPDQTEPRRQLATLLVSMGDLPGAKQVIDDALEKAPQNAQLADDRIALEQKSSGIDGALAIANQLRTKYPGLPTATALEGDAYVAAGQYAKAADAYAKALQQSPSALLTIRLAQAKSAQGDRDAAASVLRQWLTQHPDDGAIRLAVAEYDITAHRFDEAQKELEPLAAQSPPNAIALNNLAWVYQKQGDTRARSVAERAYLIAPNLAQTADTLGWILVQEGDAAAAVGLLEQATKSPAAGPAIRYHLAVALKDIGKPEEAVKLLSDLVSGSANFEEKADAEKLLTQLSKG